MWPRRQPRLSPEQVQAEVAIAETLKAGGDSLPAWNAVWDLVQSTDSQGKQEVLEALRGYVDATVSDDASVSGDATTHAREFGAAIEQSMAPTELHREVLPSKEVRQQHKRDQIEAHRKAMQELGVREGEGLPMWMLYMTRRTKRSWR